jgi:N-acetylglutamate synthase
MPYRLEVRLTAGDVGQRVVIRWRRPAPGADDVVADVLGILEDANAGSFTVRTADGTLIVIPAGRALAGKVVPPRPARQRGGGAEPR